MADLSKIKLNGTAYNLKDAWARDNLQTAANVNSLIAAAIGDITSFETDVVSTLPATGVKGTFYFVRSEGGSGNNIYNEFLWVNNSWEKIGELNTGTIDLDGYLKDTDIAAWAKAATKPSYTASEVGALATTHPVAAITSTDIAAWNAKSDFSGSYNDLTNKPTNVSSFANDAGYLTLATLPKYDGTVI